MAPNVEVKARFALRSDSFQGFSSTKKPIKEESVEQSEKSIAKDVKKYTAKAFVKKKGLKLDPVARPAPISQFSPLNQTHTHNGLKKTMSHGSHVIIIDNSLKRSKSNPNTMKTIVSELPTVSDLADKKSRKKVDNEDEMALDMSQKVQPNKEFALGNLFASPDPNIDEGIIQILKNAFSYSYNMIALNKEISKIYFVITPVQTNLQKSFDMKSIDKFAKEIDRFIHNFIEKLRKAYVLHKPHLALSSNLS